MPLLLADRLQLATKTCFYRTVSNQSIVNLIGQDKAMLDRRLANLKQSHRSARRQQAD